MHSAVPCCQASSVQTAFQFEVPAAILSSVHLRQPFILSQSLGRLFPGSQGTGDVMVQATDQASDVTVRQIHFVPAILCFSPAMSSVGMAATAASFGGGGMPAFS